MSYISYTINEVSEPRFSGDAARAVLIEDEAGGLTLYLLDDGGRAVFAFRYHGEPDGGGTTYEEMAACDWVGLHVGSCDPDMDGWDNDIAAAPLHAAGGEVVADTSLIVEENPLGLALGSRTAAARAFFRAVSEGVPEYDHLQDAF